VFARPWCVVSSNAKTGNLVKYKHRGPVPWRSRTFAGFFFYFFLLFFLPGSLIPLFSSANSLLYFIFFLSFFISFSFLIFIFNFFLRHGQCTSMLTAVALVRLGALSLGSSLKSRRHKGHVVRFIMIAHATKPRHPPLSLPQWKVCPHLSVIVSSDPLVTSHWHRAHRSVSPSRTRAFCASNRPKTATSESLVDGAGCVSEYACSPYHAKLLSGVGFLLAVCCRCGSTKMHHSIGRGTSRGAPT
jgi:hypothetical protein